MSDASNMTLAQNIKEYNDRLRESKALRTVAVDYLHMDPKEVDGMSLGTLQGHLQAAQLQSRYDEQYAQDQQRQQQMMDEQSVGGLLQNYFQAPDIPTGEGDGMRTANAMERLRYAFSNTPNASGRHMPQVLQALSKYGEVAGEGEPVVKPGPYEGVSLIMSKSGRGGIHVVTDPAAKGLNERGLPELMQLGDMDIVANKATGQFQISPFSKATAQGGQRMDEISARTEAEWLPKDAKIMDEGGVTVAVMPDGRKKYLGRTTAAAVIGQALKDTATGSSKPEPKPAKAAAVVTTDVPLVTSQAQFDALKSGTIYQERSGKRFRKP